MNGGGGRAYWTRLGGCYKSDAGSGDVGIIIYYRQVRVYGPILIYWYKIMMLQGFLRMQLISLTGLDDHECKMCECEWRAWQGSYPIYGPVEALPMVLLKRILRACSCVIWWACAGRCCCIEERGVAAGVVAAEADWFLEDLNRDMVAVVLVADKVLR
ncbi:MAG: hypothetical protein J3Q66DRAFT_344224 [Benniella sp.]|nr:MAG: hypothetical protein J3Q66DRAFT_344224 [Benniella sp.]